jgi:hypothetical protein
MPATDTTLPGRTSQQLLNAPRGAVFVWCTNNLAYIRALALHHGRTDLMLVGKSELVQVLCSGRKAVDVDHALWMTTEERARLQQLRSKMS